MIPRPSSIPHFKPLVGSDTDLKPNTYSLQKFKLYKTRMRFYLIGTDKSRTLWRVVKIHRSEPAELCIYEDPAIYTHQECNALLNRLAEGNRLLGGLKFVTKAYGIVGFIKFLEPYYMILVTKRRLLGNICGHAIYGISESRLLAIPHVSFQTNVASSKTEHRYKKLFTSIDLSKDFFFSYTYRIMWSLQKNVLMGEAERMPYDDMFVWNTFLTRGIRQQINSLQWTVALVHGYFKQARLSTCGTTTFIATLIARRSRHFAGTRYLKRGVNDKGRVANDVETEQLVHEEPWGELGQISSVIQHRGSIPLFWSQETSVLSPKPDIILQKYDPTYEATRQHFQNLAGRYGNPIIVLNLVKTVEKKPRETILCREFAKSIAYINSSLPKVDRIHFVQRDFHMFAKSASTNILEVLGSIATDALNRVGFYYSGKPSHVRWNNYDWALELREQENHVQSFHEEQGRKCRFQSGILRSNCIDCLDRTNVAQYAFGLAALGQQMHALDLCDLPQVDLDSTVGAALMEMYENMGDVLALQYGGSAAHNTVFSNRQGKWKAATQSLALLRSIRRHYSNAYTDGEKQDAINIFLGHFRPELGKLPLWQLGSDHHLQIRRAGDDPMSDSKPSFKRSFSVGNMLDQSGTGAFSPGLTFRLKHTLMNTTSINKAAESIQGLARGVFTISELDLKNTISNGSCFSNVRHAQENPFSVYSSHILLYGFGDRRGIVDYTDIDWLSSPGNSCEGDVHERYLVTAAERDWNGSEIFPTTIEEAEVSPQTQYFQDSPGDLSSVDVVITSECTNDSESNGGLADTNVSVERECTLHGPQDVGSTVQRIRTSGAATEGFFADWINGGETFFH